MCNFEVCFTDCKACDVCENCADITSDCSCQCAKGWKGKTCSGKNTGSMSIEHEYVATQ